MAVGSSLSSPPCVLAFICSADHGRRNTDNVLVWKQCTRDITDRLIWRLKDSIIHLDEKGILLSGTKKNLLLSFSWQKSETREDLHGKWECHYSCWPSWPGALNEPHVQIPVWPLASMGTWALSPPSIKASDVMDTSGTAKTGGFQLLWEAGTVNLLQFLLVCTQTNKSSFCKGQMVTGHRCRCCSFSAVKLCPPAFPWKRNYCEHG